MAADLVGQYVAEHDLERGTVWLLHFVYGKFARHLGCAPEATHFCPEVVNAWLTAMLESGLARRTVHGYRGPLLTLWRWGHGKGLLSHAPIRVKKIKVPATIPVAWSPAEVDRLLSAAAVRKGVFLRSRVPRAAFWRALILFLWDSGLRIGDALTIQWEDISSDGYGFKMQGKTGWPKPFQLRAKTKEAVDSIRSPARKLVFGGCLCRRRVFTGMKQLSSAAGLVGGTKKIRKSGATAVEAVSPGSAKGYLGHKTHGLAYRHYVDPRLLRGSQPLPPELAG